MKRISVFIAIMLMTGVCLAQPGKRSYLYNDALALKNKSVVKRLSLSDVVGKKKAIPGAVRDFKNLEALSLRPMARMFARPRGGGPCIIRYFPSTIFELPSWITDLSHLRELDLIGNTELNYVTELPKLSALDQLRVLSIDPGIFDGVLLGVLSRFTKLESLKIRANVTDAYLEELKKALPNATIVTGIYADY